MDSDRRIKRAVFVHIPRTAGRAVRKTLPSWVEDIGHTVPDRTHLDAFRFTFVRHPVDRFVSSYFHLIDVPSSAEDNSFTRRRCALRDKYGKSINKFVEDRGFADWVFPHFLPMIHWFRWGMDFVGRYESIDEDWHQLTVLLEMSATLELNVAHRAKKYDALSEKAAETVRKYYVEDMKRFSYS